MGDTKRLVESYHVTCYWHGFNEQYIWTHVKQEQARWAEYLLYRAGTPVIMSTVDERNAGWAANPAHGGHMPGRLEISEGSGRVTYTFHDLKDDLIVLSIDARHYRRDVLTVRIAWDESLAPMGLHFRIWFFTDFGGPNPGRGAERLEKRLLLRSYNHNM